MYLIQKHTTVKSYANLTKRYGIIVLYSCTIRYLSTFLAYLFKSGETKYRYYLIQIINEKDDLI